MRQVLLRIGIPDVALVTTNGAFDYNLGGDCAREGSGNRGHTSTMRLFVHSVEREVAAFAENCTLCGTPGQVKAATFTKILGRFAASSRPVNADYGFGAC